MASDFSTSLKIEKPNKGDQDNTWGATLRSNWDILDKAITAHETVDVASADVTLSDAQSRNPVLELTGALSGTRNLIVPTRDKHYWIYNNTSGSHTLTVKTSGGTGVVVTQGAWAKVFCDGTNVEKIFQDPLEGGGAIATDSGGNVFINDTTNADTTIGLTINQAANDDQILALKSSDIAHGFTSKAETDTFFHAKKSLGASGGVLLEALGEDGVLTANPVFGINAYGFQADTTKSTSARALIELYAAEHDGADAVADVTANGNVLAVRARRGAADVALMVLDEDGDLLLDGDVKASTLTIGSTVVVDDVLDEDAMGSDSATALATQQSIKAYVDATATNASWFFSSGSTSIGTGTTKDVTAINASGAVNEVRIHVEGISTDTANTPPMLQIGDSDGIETSGYSGGGYICISVNTVDANSTGFRLSEATGFDAADTWTGVITLTHLGSNVWGMTAAGHNEPKNAAMGGEGVKTLTGALDRIRFTTPAGTASFDAGTFYVVAR